MYKRQLLTCALSACGKPTAPPAEPAKQPTTQPTTTPTASPGSGQAGKPAREPRQGQNKNKNKNKKKQPTPAQATHLDLRAGERALAEAFRDKKSGVWVEAAAKVQRVLPEDNKGARHQRFIVRLLNGQTVLISHNIDLAVRVPVDVGSEVRFRGEYQWQKRGGVIHWTHVDPTKKRQGGWIEHNGKRYE